MARTQAQIRQWKLRRLLGNLSGLYRWIGSVTQDMIRSEMLTRNEIHELQEIRSMAERKMIAIERAVRQRELERKERNATSR